MREACYLCLCYDVIYSMHFDLISILIDINSIILCYFLYVSVRLKKKKSQGSNIQTDSAVQTQE